MSIDAIERDLQRQVADEIRVHPEGLDRYRVLTPFRFDDGDHLCIVLKLLGEQWVLSDEAHTFMHLTYDIDESDLHRGTRQKIISNALSVFSVDDSDGELRLDVQDQQFGNALYSFVQALLKISDVSYLSRERIRSAFWEDFKSLVEERVPEDRREFRWHHPTQDPNSNYTVDCRINSMPRPIFVHALDNDRSTRDATIALHQFERWGLTFRPLAIFQDQETIGRKVLARYTDVGENQFSSLRSNRDRISQFIDEAIRMGAEPVD